MITRAKSAHAEALATENSGLGVSAPNAEAHDQASCHISVEAAAAPNLAPCSINPNSQQPVESFSHSVASRSSSATVRALRATAEAKFARQQFERQVQLENERRRIEELELAAELASLEVGASLKSLKVKSTSRTEAWVADQKT
ncbi:hypothetical protein evm_015216 [Chilo suppressalis]|nr:hypothetical protein evm_015216 [Chilo suppressalis]